MHNIIAIIIQSIAFDFISYTKNKKTYNLPDFWLQFFRRCLRWVIRLGEIGGRNTVRLHVRNETGWSKLRTIRIYPFRIRNYTECRRSMGVSCHYSNGNPILERKMFLVIFHVSLNKQSSISGFVFGLFVFIYNKLYSLWHPDGKNFTNNYEYHPWIDNLVGHLWLKLVQTGFHWLVFFLILRLSIGEKHARRC